jgi:SPP1 gp7 family putative phage head morphogenesis protein
VTNNPLQQSFWQEEEEALWELMSFLGMSVYLAGAQSAVTMLPANVQQLVKWEEFGQNAIEFLRQYRLSVVQGISTTTRNLAVSAIENWITSGDPLDNLIASLEPLFGAARASQIGVTEVTRAYAEGNIAAWKTTGVVSGKMWMTAQDDLVCPICEPLDGMIVELDSNGFTTEAGDIGLDAPPAHANCRCWLQPFVDEAAFGDALDEAIANAS